MLSVENIHVSYGDLQVLWDVSFNVQTKEIVVLLGANGAGKSTCLRAVSSLIRPIAGIIQFEERDLKVCAPKFPFHERLYSIESRFPCPSVLQR